MRVGPQRKPDPLKAMQQAGGVRFVARLSAAERVGIESDSHLLPPPYLITKASRSVATSPDLAPIPDTAVPAPDERRYLPLLVLAFGLANLTAFARDAVIAAVFGAGARTDAYFVGVFLPTLVGTILVYESVVPALLPVLARHVHAGVPTRRLLVVVLGGCSAILCATLAAIWLESVPAVGLLAHGWGHAEVADAAALLRITACSMIPMGLGAVLATELNVRQRFFTPPLGMALMNLTTAAATVGLSGSLGTFAPAWGMLAGSVLYLALQVWTVRRLSPRGDGGAGISPAVAVARAAVPMFLFSTLLQNVVIVERWLASALPAGQISYLSYAAKLMMSPLLVVTAAGGVLAFVAMSKANVSDDPAALRVSLVRSVRSLVLLLMPATLVLIIDRRFVVELALQHGRFTGHDTTVTATLLAIYSLGLIPNGIAWLLYRSLQSRGRYWEAVRIAGIVAAAYVVTVVVLFHRWQLAGIAAAFPISQVIACLVLYVKQPAHLRLSAGAAIRFVVPATLLGGIMTLAFSGIAASTAALAIDPDVAAGLALLGSGAFILLALSVGTRLLLPADAVPFRRPSGPVAAGRSHPLARDRLSAP